MKEPSRAPFYAGIYPGLCDVARAHGYALAVHGTMARDLDLIAAPWTDAADTAEILVAAIKDRLTALGYQELLCHQTGLSPDQLSEAAKNCRNPEEKPHGRRAWLLYLDQGCSVDLSVMPRLPVR